MIVTGCWLLLFIVIHLKTFKFGPWYERRRTAMRDLARLVNEEFQHPLYVVFYVLSMAVVGLHLRHGLSSAVPVARHRPPALHAAHPQGRADGRRR